MVAPHLFHVPRSRPTQPPKIDRCFSPVYVLLDYYYAWDTWHAYLSLTIINLQHTHNLEYVSSHFSPFLSFAPLFFLWFLSLLRSLNEVVAFVVGISSTPFGWLHLPFSLCMLWHRQTDSACMFLYAMCACAYMQISQLKWIFVVIGVLCILYAYSATKCTHTHVFGVRWSYPPPIYYWSYHMQAIQLN